MERRNTAQRAREEASRARDRWFERREQRLEEQEIARREAAEEEARRQEQELAWRAALAQARSHRLRSVAGGRDEPPAGQPDVARILAGGVLVVVGGIVAGLGTFLIASGAAESSTAIGAVVGLHEVGVGIIMVGIGVGTMAFGAYLIVTGAGVRI